ncbi:hypothetical protein B484DRAFT_448927 [Ochromonadaceae sp. CCMP2298]|nr:hypothetical protein B484DRAFT_448927 [Ochromonadaceae sp. CCMP2298]
MGCGQSKEEWESQEEWESPALQRRCVELAEDAALREEFLVFFGRADWIEALAQYEKPLHEQRLVGKHRVYEYRAEEGRLCDIQDLFPAEGGVQVEVKGASAGRRGGEDETRNVNFLPRALSRVLSWSFSPDLQDSDSDTHDSHKAHASALSTPTPQQYKSQTQSTSRIQCETRFVRGVFANLLRTSSEPAGGYAGYGGEEPWRSRKHTNRLTRSVQPACRAHAYVPTHSSTQAQRSSPKHSPKHAPKAEAGLWGIFHHSSNQPPTKNPPPPPHNQLEPLTNQHEPTSLLFPDDAFRAMLLVVALGLFTATATATATAGVDTMDAMDVTDTTNITSTTNTTNVMEMTDITDTDTHAAAQEQVQEQKNQQQEGEKEGEREKEERTLARESLCLQNTIISSPTLDQPLLRYVLAEGKWLSLALKAIREHPLAITLCYSHSSEGIGGGSGKISSTHTSSTHTSSMYSRHSGHSKHSSSTYSRRSSITRNSFGSYSSSRTHCPLVYANTAFQQMSGFKASELLGTGLIALLAGAETDTAQTVALLKGVREGRAEKVALTCYAKGGRRFLNLMACRPVPVHTSASAAAFAAASASTSASASNFAYASAGNFTPTPPSSCKTISRPSTKNLGMGRERPRVSLSVCVHVPALAGIDDSVLGEVDGLLTLVGMVAAVCGMGQGRMGGMGQELRQGQGLEQARSKKEGALAWMGSMEEWDKRNTGTKGTHGWTVYNKGKTGTLTSSRRVIPLRVVPLPLRSQEAGVRSQEAGVRSQKAGVRSQNPLVGGRGRGGRGRG